MTITRRKFLAGSAIGMAALAMPAVRTAAATRKITLGGYFDMAAAIKTCWIEPPTGSRSARQTTDTDPPHLNDLAAL